MVETRDGAAAIAGIRFVGQMFESVEDMAVVQRPYHAPLGGVARANPRSQELQRQTRYSWQLHALEQSCRSD